MGNQLAGIAPSQIFPVEHYLTDQAEFKYDSNLGSTRFFKVARAKHREGLAVVKVFAIHDPSLPLRTHKEKVEAIHNVLINVPNCLPFQKAMLTEKAGILVRQYVKDNLYDRLSTRPFLNNIEKRWIAFQLLSTLAQCHKLGVCHGDIKLENVMVTSWNWVLLTDFASFKPTYLPEDNPADFSYFFDTSRRRTCYIAPERFVKTLNPDVVQSSSSNSLLLPEDEIKKGDLTHAMDIFSLGCTLVEVFTDGNSPFDFSQLLTYRSGEYSPWKILEKIDDLNIRDLVRHMIQKDPNLRLSAEAYLEQQRNLAFPEYFYTFLKEYIQGFSFFPILAPDDKVTRLRRDIKNIINILQASSSQAEPTNSPSASSSCGNGKEGLVTLVSLVTSCLRSLKHCSAKLQALETLREIAPHLSPEIILDRLLPYMLFLLHDCYPRVRVAAIEALTHCLSLVQSVPRSDANIFPEYIFPNLSHVAQDESVIVRIALAQNIAVIAETALRFLELTQLETTDQNDKTSALGQNAHHQASYDSELQNLQQMVQEYVSTLLSDTDNNVKQMLLDQGVTRLCVFFGRQKANDVLLSHMITFLNDKEDRQLRKVFFECIVGVAAYVGWQCCPILKPLLQQGMADPEEFVICKTLTALADLTELGLVQKTILYDLVGEAVPLLSHPNLWVRHGTVGFICALARTLNLADVQCKLAPLLQPFLAQPVIQFEKEVILLNAIGEPLSRDQYEYLVKLPFLSAFLDDLQERLLSKSIVRTSHRFPVETDASLQVVYRRLQSEGMNDSTEKKIIALSDHLLKIHKHRSSINEPRSLGKEQNRLIDLGQLGLVIPVHYEDITANISQKEQSFNSQNKKSSHKKVASIESPTVTMNEEWQHMFGSIDSQTKLSSEGSMSQSVNSQVEDPCEIVLEGTDVVQELLPSNWNAPEKTGLGSPSKHAEYCIVPCLNELHAMKLKKQNEYLRDQQMKEVSEMDFKDKLHGVQSDKFKPKGILVAHLHEHKQAVNRLLAIPETSLFATCSNDGTVKVWDCGKMESRSITNRSRQTYSRMEGQVTCLAVCQSLESLAASSNTGSIHVFRIESNSPKSLVQCTRTLEPNEEGCVVDMTYFDAGPQTILVYATVFGSIVGWDLRAPGTAWKLESQAKNGLITSFCVDRYHSWMVAGTACGKIICWDMRFQLPITTVTHPTSARIRRLLINPQDQSMVLASVQGNNEVSLWDMETSARRKTLWASSAPPLSQAQASSHSIYCMQLSPTPSGTTLFTGGSDMRIRSWDLVDPTDSYIVVGAANDPVNQNAVTYSSRLIDGTEVIQELYNRPRSTPSEDHPQRYPDVPPSGHHDIISDLAFVQTSQKFQKFLVSASRDGIVKVWK